jgi:hypothetical protein
MLLVYSIHGLAQRQLAAAPLAAAVRVLRAFTAVTGGTLTSNEPLQQQDQRSSIHHQVVRRQQAQQQVTTVHVRQLFRTTTQRWSFMFPSQLHTAASGNTQHTSR